MSDMETLILGSITSSEMDEALVRLRKNAALAKKIIDTRAIDRVKLRQMFALQKAMYSDWSKIGHRLYHWDDVIER